MKVLFYTGTYTHPFYKEQFKFFSKNVELMPSSPDLLATGQMRKDYSIGKFRSWLIAKIKGLGLKVYEFLKIPKHVFIKDTKNAGFVYSAQYLLKNDIPYVSDFEHAAAYSWYKQKLFNSKGFGRKFRSICFRENLKFLLPWTEAAKQSLLRNVDCSDFVDKIKVVYPAIEPKSTKKIKHDGINILFVGGAFYLKGGLDSILAFEKVKQELSDKKINFTVVSNNAPKEIVDKYGSVVQFKSKISQSELDEEYRKTDIFILPTHMDTFGFVLLEAMSYGIPCISIDNFAVPEIIADGKTGLVVPNSNSLFDSNYAYKFDCLKESELREFTEICSNPKEEDVTLLADALKKLVVNSALRGRMSKNCLSEIKHGKFSRERRIKELDQIIFS